MIGFYEPQYSPTPRWGSWTINLLLSDGSTYSSGISYTDADLMLNPSVLTSAGMWFQDQTAVSTEYSGFATCYQILDISAFDTGNVGVKGIKLSNMGAIWPDLAYIGVIEPAPVPEPSTLALAGLGGLAMLASRRRK